MFIYFKVQKAPLEHGASYLLASGLLRAAMHPQNAGPAIEHACASPLRIVLRSPPLHQKPAGNRPTSAHLRTFVRCGSPLHADLLHKALQVNLPPRAAAVAAAPAADRDAHDAVLRAGNSRHPAAATAPERIAQRPGRESSGVGANLAHVIFH